MKQSSVDKRQSKKLSQVLTQTKKDVLARARRVFHHEGLSELQHSFYTQESFLSIYFFGDFKELLCGRLELELHDPNSCASNAHMLALEYIDNDLNPPI